MDKNTFSVIHLAFLLGLFHWGCESNTASEKPCAESETRSCTCPMVDMTGTQTCTDGSWGMCTGCTAPDASMSAPMGGTTTENTACMVCTNEAPYFAECSAVGENVEPPTCTDGGVMVPCTEKTSCCARVYRSVTMNGCGDCLYGTDGEACLSAQGPLGGMNAGGSPVPMGGIEMAGGTMAGGQMSEPSGPSSDGERCALWANLSGETLRQAIHMDVSESYRPIAVELDLGGNPNRYTTARKLMFTRVERQIDQNGEGSLECLYTGFTAFAPPDRDPAREALNCEHVWPRSRMKPELEFPTLYEHQQSDLHALMPTTPDSNSTRGSLRFGIVTGNRNLDHSPSVVGTNDSGTMVFQPRPDRVGDVARITFYFSIRWGLPIDRTEESILRQWHAEDPVSPREVERNNRAEMEQGNRNPFVDCPSLLDRVPRFESFEAQDMEGSLPFP